MVGIAKISVQYDDLPLTNTTDMKFLFIILFIILFYYFDHQIHLEQ